MQKGILFLLCLIGWSASSFDELPEKGKLFIELNNIEAPEGIIWVGIYDSEATFLVKERAIVEGFEVHRSGSVRLAFPELSYGTYAIALFQDLNRNGELDRNLIGIPSEPYAFSRPPRSKWRLPRFEEIEFDFRQDGQVLRTQLRRWWESK